MTDSLNQTPLILAAKSNKYEIIEFLCKIPTINLDHCDKEGWTALRFCSWIGNFRFYEILKLIDYYLLNF